MTDEEYQAACMAVAKEMGRRIEEAFAGMESDAVAFVVTHYVLALGLKFGELGAIVAAAKASAAEIKKREASAPSALETLLAMVTKPKPGAS